MKSLSTPQRRIVLSLALLATLFSGILSGLFFATQGSRLPARSNRSSAATLVGTWKGDIGNVLNFRSDGTARWRSSSGGETGYLEWTLESNELIIYQFSSRNSISAWYVRAQRATVGTTPTDRYHVMEISPTRLKLRSTRGNVVSFVSAEDAELEAAP
jgi:hypothetical protein